MSDKQHVDVSVNVDDHSKSHHTTTTSHDTRTANLPSSADARAVLLETEAALKDTQQHPPAGLNTKGKQILTDLEHLTADQRRFLEDKNSDDVIQQIAAEAQLGIQQLQSDLKHEGPTVEGLDRSQAELLANHGNRILSSIQGLVKELATSNNFRTDIQELLQYIVELVEHVSGVPIRRITAPLKDIGRDSNLDHAAGKVADVAQEVKYHAKEAKSKGTDQIQPLTQEQQDVLLDKMARVIHNISSREESRNTFAGILDVFYLLIDQFEVQSNTETVKSHVKGNDHFRRMGELMLVFLERFTGRRVVDRLVYHSKSLVILSTQDEDVQAFFRSIRQFFSHRLDQNETYNQADVRAELEKIVHRGKKVAKTKDFGYHLSKELKYIQVALYEITNDPHLTSFQRNIRQLITDLALDENGNFNLNGNAIQQLRIVLVAAFVEKMVISIPPIQQRDEKMDFDVSNINLELKEIIPEQIKIKYSGEVAMKTGDLKDVTTKNENKVEIHIENINFSMHNLQVWWKRKKFPKSEDSGTLNIDMPGDGIDIQIVLKLESKSKDLFKTDTVDVTIDKINLKLADTRHNKLYNAFLKLAKGAIKKRVEVAMQDKITKILETINREVGRQARHTLKMGKNRLTAGIENLGNRAINEDGQVRVKEPIVEVSVHDKPIKHSSSS